MLNITKRLKKEMLRLLCASVFSTFHQPAYSEQLTHKNVENSLRSNISLHYIVPTDSSFFLYSKTKDKTDSLALNSQVPPFQIEADALDMYLVYTGGEWDNKTVRVLDLESGSEIDSIPDNGRMLRHSRSGRIIRGAPRPIYAFLDNLLHRSYQQELVQEARKQNMDFIEELTGNPDLVIRDVLSHKERVLNAWGIGIDERRLKELGGSKDGKILAVAYDSDLKRDIICEITGLEEIASQIASDRKNGLNVSSQIVYVSDGKNDMLKYPIYTEDGIAFVSIPKGYSKETKNTNPLIRVVSSDEHQKKYELTRGEIITSLAIIDGGLACSRFSSQTPFQYGGIYFVQTASEVLDVPSQLEHLVGR